MKIRNTLLFASIFLFLTGCANVTIKDPENLLPPSWISCIDIPDPIEYSEVRGISKVTWNERLERGVYISEKEDAQGVYFRAPPGGLFEGRPEYKNYGSGVTTHFQSDGGFFMPNDPEAVPRLYHYFSTTDVVSKVPDATAACVNSAYIRSSNSTQVSLVNTAIEGATAGSLGRALTINSSVSYGQAAVGGALGGMIVATIVNSDVGKIILHQPIQDPATIEILRERFRNKTVLKPVAEEQ